jgi:hypothetical protein
MPGFLGCDANPGRLAWWWQGRGVEAAPEWTCAAVRKTVENPGRGYCGRLRDFGNETCPHEGRSAFSAGDTYDLAGSVQAQWPGKNLEGSLGGGAVSMAGGRPRMAAAASWRFL